MRFLSRRLILPSDLNYANSLFGGRALEWIDEEAAIYAICQLGTNCLVTKHIRAINGRTSITVTCLMRNKITKKTICLADDIVFVQVDPITKQPIPHKKTLAGLKLQAEQDFKD